MDSWMTSLARHYDKVRALYPDDDLLILFDIDGTILDMRCMILSVLREYDEEHDTTLFQALELADIDTHENQVDQLLENLNLPRPLCRKVQIRQALAGVRHTCTTLALDRVLDLQIRPSTRQKTIRRADPAPQSYATPVRATVRLIA